MEKEKCIEWFKNKTKDRGIGQIEGIVIDTKLEFGVSPMTARKHLNAFFENEDISLYVRLSGWDRWHSQPDGKNRQPGNPRYISGSQYIGIEILKINRRPIKDKEK